MSRVLEAPIHLREPPGVGSGALNSPRSNNIVINVDERSALNRADGKAEASDEEKLRVKVIESNWRDAQRRRQREAEKSQRKSNPLKSKNLVSLV